MSVDRFYFQTPISEESKEDEVKEDGAPAVSIGGGAMSQEPVVQPKKRKTFLEWLRSRD